MNRLGGLGLLDGLSLLGLDFWFDLDIDFLESRVLVNLMPSQSFIFLYFQHLCDQILCIVAHRLGEGQGLGLDIIIEVGDRGSGPWELSE